MAGARRTNEQSQMVYVPAMTPEAREDQLISLAVDLAEKQLAEGTASSSVITHYLRLGSTRERLEKEKLDKEIELMEAKKQVLKSAEQMKEMYANAIAAMRSYGYNGGDQDSYQNLP